LSETLAAEVIPEPKLAYFRARLSNRLHELVLATFLRAEKQDGLTRAELAKRVGRGPEQISRWFASPGNWEIATVSDLLLGMGYEPALSAIDLREDASPELGEDVSLASLNLAAANDPAIQPFSGLLGPTPSPTAAGALG